MAKSKYESHVAPFLDKIAQWAEQGATAKEIAAKLKIAYSTFRKYLDEGEKGDERYAALAVAFARACEVPDDNVKAALYKRACGISYDECTYVREFNEEAGDFEEICVKRVTKFIPPDPTSAMFWLTNRQPMHWKYKPEPVDCDGDNGTGVVELPAVMEKPEPPHGEVV